MLFIATCLSGCFRLFGFACLSFMLLLICVVLVTCVAFTVGLCCCAYMVGLDFFCWMDFAFPVFIWCGLRGYCCTYCYLCLVCTGMCCSCLVLLFVISFVCVMFGWLFLISILVLCLFDLFMLMCWCACVCLGCLDVGGCGRLWFWCVVIMLLLPLRLFCCLFDLRFLGILRWLALFVIVLLE